jgi:hypothetical protein
VGVIAAVYRTAGRVAANRRARIWPSECEFPATFAAGYALRN